MNLLFKNLRWFDGAEIQGDIKVANGVIRMIGKNLEPEAKERVHDFGGCFLYPGLINSHDHLARNLFPKLGSPPYPNYVEWAKAIYKPNEPPLREIVRVSQKDLLYWGGLKNLISGVTTVVHHDAWDSALTARDFPINVFNNYAWAHSLEFEKKTQEAFKQRGNKKFIIHAAEGIDSLASAEIKKLYALHVLSSDTIIVHGVALSAEDINLLSETGTSLVWCPSSNVFLFNRTAPVRELKNNIRISLGSDSTLTGPSTFLDELKVASETGMASAEEIFNMTTRHAEAMFDLPKNIPNVGAPANFFIAPAQKKDYFENLIGCSVGELDLVMVNGNMKYASAETAKELLSVSANVNINNHAAWIDLDVAGLKNRISKHVPESILRANPLWNLIE